MKEKTLKEKIIDILVVFVMVFIMVIYNSLWKGKIGIGTVKGVVFLYPIILLTALILRTFVSLPLSRKVHKQVKILKPEKFHITIPAMTINLNCFMIVGLSTYFMHNYQPGHFFEGYLINFIRSIVFALFVYFSFVLPLARRVKRKLNIEI